MILLIPTILACAAVHVAVSTSNEDSLPVRLTPAMSQQCLAPQPVNATYALETVNRLLTDKFGAPLGSQCTCGGNAYWKRVAYLNMNDSATQCPSNWRHFETPVRGCISSTSSAGCDSAIFPTNGFTYNRVCGRVIGYQRGTPDAFEISRFGVRGIEQNYVDGLSLTHGAPGSRQHIWTFAAALYEQDPNYNQIWVCECTNTNYNWPYQVPSFVGNDYFCDTGNPGPNYVHGRVYPDDPLWDGKGCGPSSTCCQLNNPPWFCTSLAQPTSDDLELRICQTEGTTTEDIITTLVEIYVSHN